MHDHHHDHEGHSHGHHGHHHDITGADMGGRFLAGMALNIGFIAIEIAFGLGAHSLALLADASHNISDALGLGMAGAAVWASRKRPTARFTYGLQGSSILAALANAIFLMVVTGGIAWDAVLRLTHPQPVAGLTVMAVAAVGILVNGATAWLFARGRKGDLNVRAAFAHMLADAVVSAGVVVSGLLVLATGWGWIDPAASLVVAAVIVAGTWGLLKDSVGMALQAVPRQIDPQAVRAFLMTGRNVRNVHDLHIWAMSTSEVALSAHIEVEGDYPGDGFVHGLCEGLRARFDIGHATLQVETEHPAACPLAPENVV